MSNMNWWRFTVRLLQYKQSDRNTREAPQIESPQRLHVAGWCPLYPL